MTLRQQLGAAIRQRRKHKQMTQTDVAKRLGVMQNYISQIEAGAVNMTLDKVDELAQALKAKAQIDIL